MPEASYMSPAVAARLTQKLWNIGDIVKLSEEWGAKGNWSRPKPMIELAD
jgi:hypothetical protein